MGVGDQNAANPGDHFGVILQKFVAHADGRSGTADRAAGVAAAVANGDGHAFDAEGFFLAVGGVAARANGGALLFDARARGNGMRRDGRKPPALEDGLELPMRMLG